MVEARFGTEKTDKVFYEAGLVAGKAFYDHLLSGTDDVNEFIKKLQSTLEEMQIGVLRVESMSEGAAEVKLAVDENVDCSDLPKNDYEVSTYSDGLISGILEKYTGRRYILNKKDIDHGCTLTLQQS